MVRSVFGSVLLAAACCLQAGCCRCCGLPFMARPIVIQQPPVVVQQPPPPPVVQPPPKDNGGPKDQNPPKDGNPPPNNKPITNRYTYNQNTGQLKAGDKVIGTGFSGKGDAKNDPNSYKEPVIGVIPVGDWKVERRRDDPKTGEPILELTLFTGGHVKGRIPPGEHFTIHPDNSPNAGESGIAMPRNVRDAIEIPKGMFDLCIIEVREDKTAPPRPKTYTYSQSTGQLKFYSELIGTGYSGKEKGKNNPEMQDTKDIGPVPAGEYEIIMKVADPKSKGFGSKLKLNPTANFTKRWPAEDIWLATESFPAGGHPGIFIVFSRQVVDRIDFRDNAPRTRLKVVP